MNNTLTEVLSTLPETSNTADRVNILCRVLGITHEVLARETGLKPRTIHARIYGQRRSRATADLIAGYFGVEPELIFNDYHRST